MNRTALITAYRIFKEALESISKNGCCDKCQEAKRVALKALQAIAKAEDVVVSGEISRR